MASKERFAREWTEFVHTAGGKMMLFLAAISALMVIPVWLILSLI